MTQQNKIEYPYMPEGRKFKFTDINNQFMQAARLVTEQKAACSWWPTGAIIVKNGLIIGMGANSGEFQPLCPRVEQNYPSGEGYHLCKDPCKQDGHAEITCIKNTLANGNITIGADIYVYGHWWCCQNCWNHMIKAGIKNVYILENAKELFTRDKRLALVESIKEKLKSQKIITSQHTVWVIE